MIDRTELRRLAEAIERPNSWYPAGVIWDVLVEALRSQTAQEDAAFIAAASPDVVLGLLDEIDRLHMIFRDNVIVPEDEYRLITQATKNTSILLDLKASQVAAVKRSVAAEMERDQLRAVAARLKGYLENIQGNTRQDVVRWDCETALADPEVEKL